MEQEQVQLILDNLDLTVDSSKIVYKGVVNAWKMAMDMTENLLNGIPQSVPNGSILLALSAWHIYPDMPVFGYIPKVVEQHDPLFASGARLTIGLENAHPVSGDGVYWSLSLTHLQYYGNPRLVPRSTVHDSSRVSFDKLCLAVLGSLFCRWGRHGEDIHRAAQFLVSLFDSLAYCKSDDRERDITDPFGLAQFASSCSGDFS